MKCIKCGGQMQEPTSLLLDSEVRGVQLEVRMDARECSDCGHRSISGSQMQEYLQKTADAYRNHKGLLTSEELRRARARLQMTQHQFARYLGTGVASVKRWELGDIQTAAMDQLIRIKTDVSFAEHAIAELIGRVASRAKSIQVPSIAPSRPLGSRDRPATAVAAMQPEGLAA